MKLRGVAYASPMLQLALILGLLGCLLQDDGYSTAPQWRVAAEPPPHDLNLTQLRWVLPVLPVLQMSGRLGWERACMHMQKQLPASAML